MPFVCHDFAVRLVNTDNARMAGLIVGV